MQSLAVYGRLLARAFVSGLNNEFGVPSQANASCSKCSSRPLHLVTALSGIAKSQSPAQIRHKWSFGDDACFLTSQKLADVIGVADGVGGWRSYGIDPSHFPRFLMDTCERLIINGRFAPHRPKDIIVQGYNEIHESKAPLLGSCTACIVALHKDEKTLYSANLGDSGFLIIRRGEVVHRSEEQQHYFNTPFQLSIAPTVLQGQVLSDSPQSADSSSFPVREGDVIVVGTDGLFDNLSDDMILHHITKLKDHKLESIQKTANALVHEAHTLAFDPDYMSPFAFNAAENGFNIKGGKPDDVTVLLARVAAGDVVS